MLSKHNVYHIKTTTIIIIKITITFQKVCISPLLYIYIYIRKLFKKNKTKKRSCHHRTTAKPYKQNESYKFQKSLGYEPRLLTTASGWDKTKRYSNNPSWENFADEAVFRISPGKLNFGPILAEHTYRLKVRLMNKVI